MPLRTHQIDAANRNKSGAAMVLANVERHKAKLAFVRTHGKKGPYHFVGMEQCDGGACVWDQRSTRCRCRRTHVRFEFWRDDAQKLFYGPRSW